MRKGGKNSDNKSRAQQHYFIIETKDYLEKQTCHDKTILKRRIEDEQMMMPANI